VIIREKRTASANSMYCIEMSCDVVCYARSLCCVVCVVCVVKLSCGVFCMAITAPAIKKGR